VRAVAVNQLTQEGAFTAAKQLGVSLSVVTDAALGNQSAMNRVALAMDTAKQSGEAQYAATRAGTRDITSNSRAADKLGASIGLTKTAIQSATQAEKDRRAAMSTSTAASDHAAGASKHHAASTKDDAQAVAMATAKLKANAKALDDQRQRLIAAGNAAITASNDQIAYKQSVADATKAVKDNKHTLDLNTKAGRDNRTALNNLASSTLTYVSDMIKNGATTKQLTAATKDGRDKFIQIAHQMGMTRGEAKHLADQYGLNKKAMEAIPKAVHTTVSAPGLTRTIDDVKNLITTVSHVNGKTVTIKYNVMAGGTAVKVAGHGGITAVARKTGGPIIGPGSGTSDQVPIMASNGEYMLRTAAAKKLGRQRLDYMNRTGDLPGFRGGGAIDRNLILRTMFPTGAQHLLGSALAAGMNASVADAKKSAKNAVPSFPGLSGGTSGGLQAYARALMAVHGWGDSNWPALKALWNGESGWNPRAYNASSGATGIPQALPGSKMASAGSDWRTNGQTQIRWGEGYIASVYGSPSNAYRRWLSRSPHWYANGTNNARPGLAIVGENGPEAVIMRGGEQVIPHMAAAGSKAFSVPTIMRLIAAVANTVGALARLTASVHRDQMAVNAAGRALRGPSARLRGATGVYNRAVNARNSLRAANARQVHDARAVVAARQKVVDLDKREHASKRALAAAEERLSAARVHESKVSRDNANQIAQSNKRVADTEKAKKAATDAYNKAAARSKSKVDALKSAQQALAQQQQQVADAARGVSDQFTSTYTEPHGSLAGMVASMNEGAGDLNTFAAGITRLRRMGLSEAVLQDIISEAQNQGVGVGIQLEQEAFRSGSKLIGQLNQSSNALARAGNTLGFNSVIGPGLTPVSKPKLVRMPNGSTAAMAAGPGITLNITVTGNDIKDDTALAKSIAGKVSDQLRLAGLTMGTF
jgi:hypothetical protein